MRNYQYNNLTIKQFSNVKKKAQILIFVLFLLIIVGIMAGGLSQMWESEVQIPVTQENSLRAFYLAQAGIERAKIELLNNVNLAGFQPGPTPNDWYTDLDDPTDNYIFNYNFDISLGLVPTQRTIRAQGEVQDTNGRILGHREIQVTIDGIQDLVPPSPQDDDGLGTVVGWSWHEL